MKTLGNILWLVLGGLVIALIYYIVGLVALHYHRGIPWGRQHLKMAIGSIFPFGKQITKCES